MESFEPGRSAAQEVLSREAVREAAEVLAQSVKERADGGTSGELTLGAEELRVVGWFCWHRGIFLTGDEGFNETILAGICFSLYLTVADRRPGPLPVSFDETETAEEAWSYIDRTADACMSRARRSDDLLALEAGILCTRIAMSQHRVQESEQASSQSGLAYLRLRRRLFAFGEGDGSGAVDADLLLAPEAVRDAADVLAMVIEERPGGDDFTEVAIGGDEARLVGWFCWQRRTLVDEPAREDEVRIALVCFALLSLNTEVGRSPGLLPPGADPIVDQMVGRELSFISHMTDGLVDSGLRSDNPLINEGGALGRRFALVQQGSESQQYASGHNELGHLLLERARNSDAAAPLLPVLRRAITAFRVALDHATTQELKLGTHLFGLGIALQMWQETSGEPCPESSALYHQMLVALPSIAPPGHLHAELVLHLAAVASGSLGPQEKQELLRHADTLLAELPLTGDAWRWESLHLFRAALRNEKAPPVTAPAFDDPADAPRRATKVSPMGVRLRDDVPGDSPAEHDWRVEVLRDAAEAAPRPSALLAGDLGLAHLARFEAAAAKNRGDLDAAVALLERAADQCADDATERRRHLSALLVALSHLQEHYAAGLETIDRMIRVGREACRLPGDRERDAAEDNLAACLVTRFDLTGDSDSLYEADRIQRAIQDTDGYLDPVFFGQRAHCLDRLWSVTKDRAHLEEAVAAERTITERTDPDTAVGATARNNLAVSLSNLSSPDTGHAALREAIALVEDLVERSGTHGAQRADHLAGLAELLLKGREDGIGDVDRAVCIARQAVESTARAHHSFARRWTILGIALKRRYEQSRDRADLTDACAALATAADVQDATPSDRMGAADRWGRLAADDGDWHTALVAFRKAVQLLPESVSGRGHHRDQQRQLIDQAGLVADAAACAVAADRPDTALELLEQGRGILLSRAMESRAMGDEQGRLEAEHPDIARRFIAILHRRDTAWEPYVRASTAERPDLRHETDSAFHQILAEIRHLPGYADFFRAPAADRLRRAAGDGPVIILNVSRYRSDALVVTTSGVTAVPLPDVSQEHVTEQFLALRSALHTGMASVDAVEQASAGDDLRDVLHWLWHAVARPVLHALDLTTLAGGAPPRLWWCPTGLLSFLPLHAASDRDGAGFLPDLAVCSYTPTLRALEQARSQQIPGGPSLAVAVPDTPGAKPLAWALQEAQAVGEMSDALIVHGAAATRAEVMRWLAIGVRVAHFACHASADPLDASRNALLLHDGLLPAREISRLRTRGSGMAYLSACSTAQGMVNLPDEALHLAGAFQLAGFRNVISTLWPISDDVAVEAATDFYRRLGEQPSPDPAEAVTHMVRALRARYPRVPALWASHLHMGV
ncbi:CHAT domain-containing protein [Streptomyces sp. NPDC059224]|uniref:CHAT domain-containing protein n=1 Tax=Streptomyces sp. NPDC059224 TaxID=3346775 RepID=UPI0036973BB6